MKTILRWVITKKGNEFQVALPARRIVCPRCDGTGTHDHPAFSNGVDHEHLEDPDFSENYLRGHYDVRCEECNGDRVVLAVDWDALTPKMRDRLARAEWEAGQSERERESERRMGA